MGASLISSLILHTISVLCTGASAYIQISRIWKGSKVNNFDNRVLAYFILCLLLFHTVGLAIIIFSAFSFYGKVSILDFDKSMGPMLNVNWGIIVLASNFGIAILLVFWKISVDESRFLPFSRFLTKERSIKFTLYTLNIIGVVYIVTVSLVFWKDPMRQRLWCDLAPFLSWFLISVFSIFPIIDFSSLILRLRFNSRNADSEVLYQNSLRYCLTIFIVYVATSIILIVRLISTFEVPLEYYLLEGVAQSSPRYTDLMPGDPDFSMLFGGTFGIFASMPILLNANSSHKKPVSSFLGNAN